MAKKTEEIKEELANDKDSNDRDSRGDTNSKGVERGELGGVKDSNRSGTGSEGREPGSKGGEPGSEGGGKGSGAGSEGSEADNRKLDLLQSIRNKRLERLGESSGTANGASPRDSKGNGGGSAGTKRGTTPNPGASSGDGRDDGRGGRQNDASHSGTDSASQTNDRNARIKDSALPNPSETSSKAQGVKIKGVDKIKALAEKATQAEPPKLRFSWDEKPLTNKEADEMLPKMRALLGVVFRGIDNGITLSNRNRAKAEIWSTIDDEDIDIIASHMVEMAKASKIVATAVRRMTNSYRLFQIGVITLPKFIQTYQFYAQNGGLALLSTP